MQHNHSSFQNQLEELKPIDISRTKTVGEIVDAMSYCSFGARMLGEIAKTICRWAEEKNKPVIVYDGRKETLLGRMLIDMKKMGWVSSITTPQRFSGNGQAKKIIVVGSYSERFSEAINRAERAIFINQYGIVRDGQMKEGFYPDFVCGDPRWIIPVIYSYLDEKLEGKWKTANELINETRFYGGLASEVYEGQEVFFDMTDNPAFTVFLTIAGAMTVAKMGLIFCDLIDQGKVNFIATTGALMAHGLVEGIGLKHYKYNPKFNDQLMAKMRMNRVTDTIEPEENLDSAEFFLREAINLHSSGDINISPSELNRMLGINIWNKFPNSRGILKSAYERNVPIIIPAFYDSELGNDVLVENLHRETSGNGSRIYIDIEKDCRLLIDECLRADKIAIFSIGGGVPRNIIQNVSPTIEIANERLGLNWEQKKFERAARIDPTLPYWGNLSGCTYSEGMSWRKIDPNAKLAEVHSDATLILPFLARSVLYEY